MAIGNIKEVQSLSMSIIVLTTYVLNVMATELKCPSCNQMITPETGWDTGYRELNRVQGKWFQMYDPQPQDQESSDAPNHLMRRSHSEPSINEAYNYHARFQKTEHKERKSNRINSASATPNKIVQVTNIWCGSESFLNTRKYSVIPPVYNEGRLQQLQLGVKEGKTYLDLLLHACTNDEVAYLRGAMGVFNTFQVVKHEGKETKSLLHATMWEVKKVKQRGDWKVSIEFTFGILVDYA